MGAIEYEILEVVASLGLRIHPISKVESNAFRKTIARKFANGHTHWLWQNMPDMENLYDPKGWELSSRYVRNKQNVIIFFNELEEETAFLIEHGSDVEILLGETTGFEYYLTNQTGDYLLCFNHHDYLIAAGDAKPWLEDIVRSRSE